ncbi:MAG: aminopeptidase P family protein [Octadecabacter sp.]|nr:aminopeptidase P family protein [Octadecabacter sp.]
MFQTFEVTSSPETGPARLAAVRAEMAVAGLDGFLVPRADAHQGEYVAPCDARLAWLTGFTGSAGFCAILADRAGVFIDGRYRVQVRDQVAEVFTPVHWPEVQLGDWLAQALPSGARVGFDPWLHTLAEVEALRARLANAGLELVESANLVDAVWRDRPAPPAAQFSIYPDDMAGETSASKRARLAKNLQEDGQVAAAITLPDSIAWLLNIRGADIERNPVPLAFAILHADGTVDLFCNPVKVTAKVTAHLGPDVRVLDVAQFGPVLAALAGAVRVDPKTAPQWIAAHVYDLAAGQDPCILPKARKTEAEIAGSRAAHLRDGAAMVRFLAWLDAEAPKGGLTEIDVVMALERFRRDTNALRDISFETICGAGPNGAIVHYRVNEATNRPVKSGELLLVDSGGQYLDGTTDITRTVAVGDVGAEEKACYTRVLQGMIAISSARFPKGVAGAHLDALARTPLWQAGMDYDHGTGHGVGAYLSVHEGPQGISRRAETPLEAGMILSNEPGYYREGAFGIRIENLIVVRAAAAVQGGDARDMLDFETLTYVPLDRRLIDTALLSREETTWIDAYHADTQHKISPLLDGAASHWLQAACAPL